MNTLVQGVMQRCIPCPWQLSVGPICLCRTHPSLKWTPLEQRLALYISRALAPPWKDMCSNQKIWFFLLILNRGWGVGGGGGVDSNKNWGKKKRKRIFKFSTSLLSLIIKKIGREKRKKENWLPSYNVISNCPFHNRDPQELPCWENKRI